MSRGSYLISDAAKRSAPLIRGAVIENPVFIPSAIDRGHVAIVPLQKRPSVKQNHLLLNSSNLVFCRSCCLSVTSSKSGEKLGHVVFHAAGYPAEKEDVVNFSQDFWRNSGVGDEVLYDVEAVHSGPLSYRDSQTAVSCDEDIMEIIKNLGADPIKYLIKQEECDRASDDLSREVFGFAKYNYHKLTNAIGLNFKVASFVFDGKDSDFLGSFSLASGAHADFVESAKLLKDDAAASKDVVVLDEKLDHPVLVYTSFAAAHPNVKMVEGARYCNPEYHKQDIEKAACDGKVVQVAESFPKIFSKVDDGVRIALRGEVLRLDGGAASKNLVK